MIPMTIVAISTASILTLYNYYRLKPVKFISTLTVFSSIMLFSIIFFFTFDKSSVRSAGIEDLEDLTNATFKDIETLTTSTNSKKVDDKDFANDKRTKQKNDELFTYSFYIVLTITILLLVTLKLFSKKDYLYNIRNIFLNIIVVKIIELYFIFVFKNNYKDQPLEVVRKEIIKKFKEV
jgi:hypothetical protein